MECDECNDDEIVLDEDNLPGIDEFEDEVSFEEIVVSKDDSVSKFTGHSDAVWCISLNSKSVCAISGGMDDKICIWKVDSGEKICDSGSSHSDTVNFVSVSESDKYFASSDYSGNVIIWTINNKAQLTELYKIEMESAIVGIKWIKDLLVSCSNDGIVQGWSKKTNPLYIQGKGCCCVAMDTILNGKYILVVYGGTQTGHEGCCNQYTVALHDLQNESSYSESFAYFLKSCENFGRLVSTTISKSSGAAIVAISCTEQILVITIPFNKPNDAAFIKTFVPVPKIIDTLEDLSLSDDFPWLSFCGYNGKIGIYDLSYQSIHCVWDNQSESVPVTGLYWVNHTPKLVAATRDAKLIVWDARSPRNGPISVLTGHTKPIWNVEFSKTPNEDGLTKMVSVSDDETCRVFMV